MVLNVTSASAKDFDGNYRFIFYAVLEGCYEDGIATTNVDQILLMKTNVGFVHFVYACPICTPTIHALEAYRSRPQHLYGLKTRANTFGPGLTPEQISRLYSDNSTNRLTVINELMHGWIARRMTELRLSDTEKAQLQADLEKMRKQGMQYLKPRQNGDPETAEKSAVAEVRQCAACNGACSLTLLGTNFVWPR
ncbi:MAG TPA: hypothetical protein VG347_03735 [Verrucomicrobiae bacterium]|nr:hypothetical protein [Verrucomicrobiae bacterium]